MGNTSCGDLCHDLRHDKQEILQIEITPRYDAVDWIKDEQTTGPEPMTAKPSEKIIEHYNIDNHLYQNSRNYQIQLIHWDDDPTPSADEVLEMPVVQTKIQQNHLVVPNNLVKERVSDHLKLLMKQQFSRSPLEDKVKWYLLPSGNYYTGQLKNSVPSGVGTYILPNKVFYGEMSQDKPHGMGVVLSQDYIFKGQFDEGKASGSATFDSTKYKVKGNFNQGGLKQGKVVTAQFTYEGQFLKGQPSGKGSYKNVKMYCEYDGEFLNGKFHGQGEYRTSQYVYKGSFQNGQKHGNGVIEYVQGQFKRMEGVWDQDYFIRQRS